MRPLIFRDYRTIPRKSLGGHERPARSANQVFSCSAIPCDALSGSDCRHAERFASRLESKMEFAGGGTSDLSVEACGSHSKRRRPSLDYLAPCRQIPSKPTISKFRWDDRV